MSDMPIVSERTEMLHKPAIQGGLLSWVASVDHKVIGIMYILSAVFFFVVGGVEAGLMRWQLGTARNSFLTPEAYNQVFTMHGTTMVFLVVIPLVLGFSVYLVPLQIGARDMAFPRLNLLGFWVLVFGGLLMYFSFVAGGAPNAGWFAYAPLSEKPYNTSPGMDYWALGQLVMGVGTVATGLNLLVTIITLRATNMKLVQVPMFTWTVFVNSFLIITAMPIFNAALVMLIVDRQLGGNFFKADAGGSAVLWQHYFWGFGHPEVYIMILPGFGMISEIIPVFSRKPLFGFGFVAGSTVAIAFLSYAVYAHHMLAVGLGKFFDTAFGFATELIAIPTGIKIFNWIATLWGGKLRLNVAMLYALAFIVNFTIGGVSGVSFALVPLDWQTTDSYYVVAHMHYVIFGGILLAALGGAHYWFPKMTGRFLDEKLGTWDFWLYVIGFNTTFMVQHFLGLMGMPRRVYTYPDLPGWSILNQISTGGYFIMAIATLLLFYNIYISLKKGKVAGPNPWEAWTLEWHASSPPAIDNFDSLPPIRSRRPLWDLAHPEMPDWKLTHSGELIEAGPVSGKHEGKE